MKGSAVGVGTVLGEEDLPVVVGHLAKLLDGCGHSPQVGYDETPGVGLEGLADEVGIEVAVSSRSIG
nr:hypothetical protein [Streptoalloteichus tenebrarius]BFE98939.1 hypothetical protein GCM10020241_06150 [Streptoalloteichus tenebrarius]